ncbi:eCIS core domain-containing protein [Candidatus Laterigemmans baculatus]|uniref:eCIS core domain-containing protein n=1 Tax=Candidatus Laterigemmans baculatus TaxID=2770505 RepID=UPI0013D95ED0|nr:DUF4157 domain-containing protein [Candidatus Laterigemmans baculatus]
MTSLLRLLATRGGGAILLTLGLFATAHGAEPDSLRVARLEVAEIEFVFATPEQGRAILSRRDAYLERLSPFDRQSRRQSREPVDEAEYLEFVRGEVRPWEPAEQARVAELLKSLDTPLANLSLPPLNTVHLIHTSGREESGAAYTRGSAIVLPATRLQRADQDQLKTLLAHELFHVLSRQNPELRDQLYALIGFAPSNEIELPESLAAKRITNPDAPAIAHVLQLKLADDSIVSVAPVLFANADYDPASRASMFAYLTFQLMQVQPDAEGQFQAVLESGAPVFHSPSEPDYRRQIGRNTGYIIHPEEVLADNFAMLVTGNTDVPDPWLLDALRKAL